METKVEKIRTKKWAIKWLLIAFALILISCVGASALQTNFGKTQVYTFKVPTSDGKYLSCNMYRPKEASADNKVPLVIAMAGTYASKEQMDIPGIELSRRGIAVITFDPYMHGLSSGGTEPYSEFAWTDAGMIALVEFASDNLDFVDNTKIGVTGHSLGGRVISNTLAHYGVAYENALAEAQNPDSDGGEEITAEEQAYADSQNKVMAAFASGVQTSEISFGERDDTFAVHGIQGAPEDKPMPKMAYASVAVYNGFNDEFGRGNYQVDGVAYPLNYHPDMIHLLNQVLPEDQKVAVGDTPEAGFELDTYYGSAEDHTLRIFYNPPEIHAYERFSATEASCISDFFTTAFEMDNPIAPGNQYWRIKEIFNCIGLIGMFLLVVPMASLLMNLNIFKGLAVAVPEKLPALKTGKSKLIFWGVLLISAILSWQFFLPAIDIARVIFPAQQGQNTLTWLFPQSMTNFIWIWAMFNTIVGLAFFFITYHFSSKKNGVTPDNWGIKISARDLGRTLLLALMVIAAFFSVVFIANYFFVVDFRIWVLAIKVFKPIHIVYALSYAVMFFPYYFMVSLSTNGSRRVAGQNEFVNLLICGVGNILGLALMQAVMYLNVYVFNPGINPYGSACLNCIQTYQLLVLLFVAPILTRYLFKLTGKMWLGSFVTCLMVVTINVANSMLHIPA